MKIFEAILGFWFLGFLVVMAIEQRRAIRGLLQSIYCVIKRTPMGTRFGFVVGTVLTFWVGHGLGFTSGSQHCQQWMKENQPRAYTVWQREQREIDSKLAGNVSDGSHDDGY
jgi:hypothetical protein